MHGRVRSPEVEAISYQAISWAVELGFENITFETDCRFLGQ